MNQAILRQLLSLAVDILLALAIVAACGLIFMLLLNQDLAAISIWGASTVFLSTVAIFFLMRQFRRRAYGIVEVAVGLAVFTYALYTVQPSGIIPFVFQSSAAVYIAIRGLDNIVTFHKKK
jgi:hypothetical protein